MQDKNIEKYIKSFENHFNGQSTQAFHQVRRNALDSFKKLGFPTTKIEEWRFTNVNELVRSDFTPAKRNSSKELTAGDIKPFIIESWKGALLVFVDGYYQKNLSKTNSADSEILIGNLNEHFINNNGKLKKLTSVAAFDDDPFTALNTAFTLDGTIIEIPKGKTPDNGIHILHVSSGKNLLSNHRNLIVVNENSVATIIETYHSLNNDPAFVNSVTEITVGENAQLKHYKFQDEAENTFHIGSTAVIQKANSKYTSISMDFGGKLVRNNLSTRLDGEGITSVLNGLYIAHNKQHIDNHTFIDHAKAHCESHELYRGILNDSAKGVFSGKILVRQDAQKTDAKQSNNALLLSDEAQIDAKPQLEIYADDVKCTHGATVGQLDEKAVNYLRTRGIPGKKAIQMLTYAFAEEIIIGIENEPFRQKIENRLLKSLEK